MQHLYRTPPTRRGLLAALSLTAIAGALALAGCSRTDDSTAASAAATAKPGAPVLDAYDQVAQQTKGFTVGPLMAANPVYVLFDPQCPHCGHLWQASLPLLKKVKFVWVPVAIVNAKSAPQGAALLTATNPVEAMNAHETSILAGSGGTSAPSSMAPDIEAAIKANTQALNALKAESVPMLIAKNASTGAVITRVGALDTAGLASFLGVTLP